MRNLFYSVLSLIFCVSLLSAREIHSPAQSVRYKVPKIRSSVLDPLGVKQHFLAHTERSLTKTDTLKILALRAEFVRDNLATTTGDGGFDLRTSSDLKIDRPPHNRTYFQHQLLALSNYFYKVSGKRLVLRADVFPKGEDDAYQLPHDMAYYSGQEDETLKRQRWSELLQDAIAAADDGNSPVFGNYDTIIIFHAGVGADFSFDFDSTPFDIQSVFIDFETLKETLGAGVQNFKGIRTKNGSTIKEGIILPEMQNQAGQDLALLGTMTLLMGSQLGMPSLFDTESGRAGIGRWGLMDQGSYNFQGLIPAEPCAWTKIYMGWEKPVIIHNAQQLKVGITKTRSAQHIFKIPISASEYFLIENRQRDWNGDKIAVGRDENGQRMQFDSTGTVLAEDGFGVLTRFEEYDFGLPGSGILIWHIDEKVIEANLTTNTINNDRDHRGVDLVECDGAQDIGYYYSFLEPGYGTEAGDYFDPYWAGNASHKTVNESETVEFSPTSIPNSNAYDGGETGIRIFNFSNRDTVMTLSVTSGLWQQGFPQYTGSSFSTGSLLAFDIADNQTAIIATRKDGNILGWKSDGSRLIENTEAVSIVNIYGDTVRYDLAIVAVASDSVLLAPASIDADGDGLPEIVVADNSGTLYLWTLTDADGDGRADLLDSVSLDGMPSAGPMILSSADEGMSYIVVGTHQGGLGIYTYHGQLTLLTEKNLNAGAVTGLAALEGNVIVACQGAVFSLQPDGDILWQQPLDLQGNSAQPIVADFDGQAGLDVAVVSDRGEVKVFSADGAQLAQEAYQAKTDAAGTPAVADPDNDGVPEIVFVSSNRLHSVETSGVSTGNFPQSLSARNGEFLTHLLSPLSLKRNNSRSIILAPIPNGVIKAFQDEDKDYHLSSGANIIATPVLKDIDHDGDLDLLALTSDGFLCAWDLDYVEGTASMIWAQYGGNQFRNFALPGHYPSFVANSQLMPPKGVYCYPNPTGGAQTFIRYSLTRPADRVNVRIYDLAGDLVRTLNSASTAAGDHDLVWNISDIQSGVYFARVQAIDGKGSNTKIIKIAVVK